MGIYLSTKELEAMVGIQHLQKLVYTHGIRPYMDFATGIVGIKRGISWQSISEALYVEPAPGIKGGSPKKHPIRTAVDGLVRVGLLQPMSTPKKLIFKCLLAETDISKQNKDGTKLAREVVTQKNGNRITTKANTEARHSHSDRVSKNVEGGTLKNDKGGTPPSVRDFKSSTSSTNAMTQDDDDKILIFPTKLSSKESDAIRNLLKGFNHNQSQVMLDELSGHMSAKQINSPVGYFRAIVRDARNGIFQPERAHRVEAGRATQLAIQKQIAESTSLNSEKKISSPTNKKDRPSLREALKNSNKTEVTA